MHHEGRGVRASLSSLPAAAFGSPVFMLGGYAGSQVNETAVTYEKGKTIVCLGNQTQSTQKMEREL